MSADVGQTSVLANRESKTDKEKDRETDADKDRETDAEKDKDRKRERQRARMLFVIYVVSYFSFVLYQCQCTFSMAKNKL